jgi:hypothetical protein
MWNQNRVWFPGIRTEPKTIRFFKEPDKNRKRTRPNIPFLLKSISILLNFIESEPEVLLKTYKSRTAQHWVIPLHNKLEWVAKGSSTHIVHE